MIDRLCHVGLLGLILALPLCVDPSHSAGKRNRAQALLSRHSTPPADAAAAQPPTTKAYAGQPALARLAAGVRFAAIAEPPAFPDLPASAGRLRPFSGRAPPLS